MAEREIIKNNFSKIADKYDSRAFVQKQCAGKLIEHLAGKEYSRILEVGCGTGILTELLRNKNKDSKIEAIDISDKMVKMARRKFPGGDICFRVADGEKAIPDGRFDLITSNASFQWFGSLENTFSVLAGALNPGGTLCFSMYGPETFVEFKEVLSTHYGRRQWLSASRFLSRQRIESILRKHFSRVEFKEEMFKVDFLSLWDFLRDIKYSGTRGEGLGGGVYLGKYAILQLEKTYIEKFKGIFATHHVYFCKAQL